ncbi:hypothetical protein [Mesorhizobium sp. M0698]|uniref:hypothetical protein n=1 Tax=Mesorhizobium sp. M0698 TaxID=2956987 RepID=UPI00333B2748
MTRTRELETAVWVQRGRERRLILHKLMEEVLTGETEAETAVAERAGEFIRALRRFPVADPATGLSVEDWRAVSSGPLPALNRGLAAGIADANSDV